MKLTEVLNDVLDGIELETIPSKSELVTWYAVKDGESVKLVVLDKDRDAKITYVFMTGLSFTTLHNAIPYMQEIIGQYDHCCSDPVSHNDIIILCSITYGNLKKGCVQIGQSSV